MSNFSWWVAANKVANFSLLIAVCWYLVCKHLYPSIKKKIQARVLTIVALEEDLVANVAKNREVAQTIQDQEAYAALLLIKIQTWKSALAVKKEQSVVREELLEKKCLLYLQQRADGLCQERLKKDTFPYVFKQTHDEVTSFFQDKTAHALYVKNLIAQLPQGKARE